MTVLVYDVHCYNLNSRESAVAFSSKLKRIFEEE